MIYCYARTSTTDQNVQQQILELKKYHPIDRVFSEQLSGKDTNRPQYNLMLENLREGDTVVAYDISRIGRNVADVLEFAQFCKTKNVKLIIQALGSIDVTSCYGNLVMTILAAVAELQRSEMLEKQRIGIETAKAAGKYKGKQISPDMKELFKNTYELVTKCEYTVARALQTTKMKKATYYRLLKNLTSDTRKD